MRDAGQGRIINVSSIYGRTTTPLTGWYQATKHALEALSDALRMEVASSGVKVVLVEPGGFKTGIWEEFARDVEGHRGSRFEAAYRRSLQTMKLTQVLMGQPQRVAVVIARAARLVVPARPIPRGLRRPGARAGPVAHADGAQGPGHPAHARALADRLSREEFVLTIQHKVVGESMQMTVCQLGPEQSVFCEAGKFLWKTVNVSMETRLTKPDREASRSPRHRAGGGRSPEEGHEHGHRGGQAGSGRREPGVPVFRASGQSGLVVFAGVLPGQVRVIELDGTTGWFAEKDAFVAAESTVDFDIAFQGWKTGRKGGEGFVLEKFTGRGTLFLAGAGNFIDLNPAKYGGKIQVDTGCIVAFQDTVKYGIERVGGLNMQTAMTAMFGGEGLSLATLEGDGQVIIQSMTYDGLANAIAGRIGGDDRRGLTGGLLGGGND